MPVATSVMLALLVLLVGVAVTRSPAIAGCFALIAVAGPAALVRGWVRSHAVRLRDVWPEVIDHLASGMRAGRSLPEALGQLVDRGPAEVREPFLAFADDYRATARSGCPDAGHQSGPAARRSAGMGQFRARQARTP